VTAIDKGWISTLVACIVLLAPLQVAPAAQTDADPPPVAQVSLGSGDDASDLSFAGVFPKPFYQKTYFAWLVLGASIVVAGTISYFTAGAGAPAAATGVSTVASTIAGGGAGSYMAGLSIVGGWFGGNAMLGSAILNGIAFGLGGGGAAFASLTAIGKVGVLSSVTATALDGVLVYLPPEKKEIVYRVRLTVPDRIGSSDVKDLVDELNEAEADLVKIASKLEKARSNSDEEKVAELTRESRDLVATRKQLLDEAAQRADAALTADVGVEDLLVLAILSKNAGKEQSFQKLLRRIPAERVMNRSYLDYLAAVTRIERGEIKPSDALLRRSWGASPYAVEPALLLVHVLGHNGFTKSERAILEVVSRAEKQFDRDEYASSYSLLALYYRVAAMYFMDKRYQEAQEYYEKAYKELPWTQKYFGNKQLKNLIRLGIANSLYGQNQRQSAQELFAKLLKDAETDEEKELLRSQFVPNMQK
jgi:tetratricopeptide (TPR) repeat protein